MLAVADIFEALAAGERPYRRGRTLREALGVMEELKERNHIDPDVYDVFLKADIPQRYAAKFLKPEQNDLDSRPYGATWPSRPENLHIWPSQGVARGAVFT